MRFRNQFVCTAVIIAAIFAARPGWAQTGGNRFGVWDNSTDPNNVMTYEPFDKGGSKLTVSNPSKPVLSRRLGAWSIWPLASPRS